MPTLASIGQLLRPVGTQSTVANYCDNPGATFTGGWLSNSASLYPVSYDTTFKYAGTRSVKATVVSATTAGGTVGSIYNTGTKGGSYTDCIGVAVGQLWRITIMVSASVAFQGRIRINWLDSAGGAVSTLTGTTSSNQSANQWVKLSQLATVPATAARMRITVDVLSVGVAPAGSFAWFDSVLATLTTTYTDVPIDGDTGHFRWEGTSGASRTLGVLVPNTFTYATIPLTDDRAQANLCPSFGTAGAGWNFGSSSYNGTTKEVTVPLSGSAYAVISPLIPVFGLAWCRISAEFWADQQSQNVPYQPNAGCLWNITYWQADGTTAATSSAGFTTNGSAQQYPQSVWTRSSYAPAIGSTVAFIKFNFSATTYGPLDGFRVRLPVVQAGITSPPTPTDYVSWFRKGLP